MLAVQSASLPDHGRAAFEASRPRRRHSVTKRRANPPTMPALDQLRNYGLQVGDRARSRDTDCTICQERVKDPVVTECRHIYCFECIQQWLRRSIQCPDCRRRLHKERVTPGTSAATTTSAPTGPARYSSMRWVADAVLNSFAVQTPSIHSLATSQSTLSLRSEANRQNRMSQASFQPSIAESESASSIQESTSASSAASWCLQRRMPLRNRAAHPTGLEGMSSASSESLYSAQARRKLLDNTGKHLPPIYIPQQASPQPILHPPPRSQSHNDLAADYTKDCDSPLPARRRLITVDAEEMLSKMWQISSMMAESMQITIRCRAMAKCAWREWREFLEANDGRDVYADDLLKALSRNFERMVCEYGWADDWRLLPEPFIHMMKKTAKAAVGECK
ncbi:hypothetical protein AC579_3744 [Pseudocercospora musae]|uniref:RING-type domain-containing protein n=1 Tax=Pseudocercospora musae TaxID=113226 RepID=A0A139INZ0_9PEZI|nr:hypothetical protein AC579_3744 [Pseudocercospora musae]